MAKPKSANGPRYNGVLERQRHSGPTPTPDGPDQAEAPAAQKKKGRDPKVNGHTIYFHDDQFELIMVEAKRRKLTISDYVVWCLRAAPHQKLSVKRETAPDASTTTQTEQPPSEAIEDEQAAA